MSSSSLKRGLSNEQIETVLRSNADPINVNFHKEHDDEVRAEYKGTQAEWQMDKKEEIDKLFNNNLKITFDDSLVKLAVEFNIGFPSDWEKGFVLDWCEGFIKIAQAYFFVHSEKISEGDNNYKEIKIVLDEILKKQKVSATC